MAEDSTPVLRGSLDECFIEQQLALKQLTVQYEDLEDTVEVLNSFFTQLDGNPVENKRNLEKLEKRVAELETELEKTELLEERVSVLNIRSIELRNHLNLTIDTLNNVVKILNSQVIDEEPTDEVTSPHEENPDGEILYPKQNMDEDTQPNPHEENPDGELIYPEQDMDEDTQPTLTQVYDMYQTQPSDEEGW